MSSDREFLHSPVPEDSDEPNRSNHPKATMHWFITGNLTTISLLLSGALQALAKPLPDLTAEAALSASLAEIERRWSEGQSEVCSSQLSRCYVLVWARPLMVSACPSPLSRRERRSLRYDGRVPFLSSLPSSNTSLQDTHRLPTI